MVVIAALTASSRSKTNRSAREAENQRVLLIARPLDARR